MQVAARCRCAWFAGEDTWEDEGFFEADSNNENAEDTNSEQERDATDDERWERVAQRSGVKVTAGCRLQVAGRGLQVAECRLQAAGCTLQVAGCMPVQFAP